ncbi:MAG: beta-galactosidase [Thermoproteota archaeon]|nr:beta-galactosidase [Candidatus Brockarchaeota archaeon]
MKLGKHAYLIILFVIFLLLLFSSYSLFTCFQSLRRMESQLDEYDKDFKSLASLIFGLYYDDYGGVLHTKGRATGFFHVEKIGDVWWIINPEGNVFLSKGVNAINFQGDYSPALGYSPYNRAVLRKYGNSETWARATVTRLCEYGFNTIGAWSSEELFTQGIPYTIILNIAARAGAEWVSGRVTDFFSQDFERIANEVAEEICAARRNDPYLLGYFTDNELRWSPDWRSSKHLFDDYIALERDAPGKRALVQYLESKYGSIRELNAKWGMSFNSFEDILDTYTLPQSSLIDPDRLGFLEVISRRYFQVCHDAIRRHDPNHMILGCRFAFRPPDEVLKGCIGYIDVISMNNYGWEPPVEDLREMHNLTGLPIMITEFSFKAMDSGLPNTRGAGSPLATQKDRAERFEKYVSKLLSEPYIVGYHWFQYADQPAQGRFDGENSNFGLVNIEDEPWKILVTRATVVNLKAELIHARSVEKSNPP